jgi:hypothetical protein
MFFTKHPYTTQLDKNGNQITVTDITSTIKTYEVFRNTQYSIPYYVREGDTAESIAKQIYNKQSYSWIILLVNNMKGIYTDWPLSSTAFDAYVKNKYGGLSSIFFYLDSINNYNIKKGDVIRSTTSSSKTAEVVDWNPSLSKLTIRQLNGTFTKNEFVRFLDTTPTIAKIGRVNLYEQDSLHHFEANGIYLDPLLGYLQGYINGVSNEVITNYQYEMTENDKKRYIYIPLPEVATRIEQEYSNSMAV